MFRPEKTIPSAVLFVLPFLLFAKPPEIVYSTVIGGQRMDFGHAMAVDPAGCVYIAGQATSPDYPATAGSFDASHNGGADVLITKLNESGSALVYSTFLGGSGRDSANGVFLDSLGCAYVTGGTASTDFPSSTVPVPGYDGGFLVKMDPSGKKLEVSLRLAGSALIDSKGRIIVFGSTESPSFPTTANAFQPARSGKMDAFVMKIDMKNNSTMFSTLVGGNGNDRPYAALGDAFLTYIKH